MEYLCNNPSGQIPREFIKRKADLISNGWSAHFGGPSASDATQVRNYMDQRKVTVAVLSSGPLY